MSQHRVLLLVQWEWSVGRWTADVEMFMCSLAVERIARETINQ